MLLKALLVRINVAINRTASDKDSASLCRGLQERRRRIMGILYKAETEDISDKPEASKDTESVVVRLFLKTIQLMNSTKLSWQQFFRQPILIRQKQELLKSNTSKKTIDTLIFLETSSSSIIKLANCPIHN